MEEFGLKSLHDSFSEKRLGRTEADIQAAISSFLMLSPLGLHDSEIVKLEEQVKDGTRRRLDVTLGKLIVEVKKDLSNRKVLEDGIGQLGGYLETRSRQESFLFSGVITDGGTWYLLGQTPEGNWSSVSQIDCQPQRADSHKDLISWLGEILLTGPKRPANATVVTEKFGSSTAGHELDISRLRRIYEQISEVPAVALKRSLWARLLRTALGENFKDNTELFLKHSLLVYQAEIVAHLVVGQNIESLAPSDLVLGKAFKDAQIFNVVEEDFFDWILESGDGAAFLEALARRVSSVDWTNVEHDVLKTLYQSVIDPETRKKLGEYYTPDWLALEVIDATLPEVGDRKIMDPSCGSGTFLFHLVRRFLRECDEKKLNNRLAIELLQNQIFGIDLHPVSVVLARVTYLLAIGTSRLRERGPIAIPVFLGDSLQWFRNENNVGKSTLRVPVDLDEFAEVGSGTQMTLFVSGQALEMPLSTLESGVQFDTLVDELAKLANTVTSVKSPIPSIQSILDRHHVSSEEDRAILTHTFETLCELNALGRNHIWGYFIRNQLRPAWLSLKSNQVDVLVGNPPWVAYRHMSSGMQNLFKESSKSSGLWTESKLATQMDLVALFIVRASSLYLKPDGLFGFVTPWSVLTGPHYAPFRSGSWGDSVLPKEDGTLSKVRAEFMPSWDLSDLKGELFPQTSAVIFGKMSEVASSLPRKTRHFKGTVKNWTSGDSEIPEEKSDSAPKSHYFDLAFQGASILPRVLFMVDREETQGPLGNVSGEVLVHSKRVAEEKVPWKELEGISGRVESEFIKPIIMGSSIGPFRLLTTSEAAMPVADGQIIVGQDLDRVAGKMSARWQHLDTLWKQHRQEKSPKTLLERLNYQSSLEKQLPSSRHRVVYTTSGTRLCATVIRDQNIIIDHKLYWIGVGSESEAQYLSGILNSEILQDWVNPRQSKGLFGARDFHRIPLTPPFPKFDLTNPIHADIANFSAQCEALADSVELSNPENFKKSRGLIFSELHGSEFFKLLNSAVAALNVIPQDVPTT